MAERKTEMTVREAGHKGGSTTKQRYGEGFYEEIGRKGGHKVRELINRGKEAMGQGEKEKKPASRRK